jgi:hypothetical protein
MPSPPIPAQHTEHDFDGPRRKRRREKLEGRAKVGFAERERGLELGSEGHVLWCGDERLEGWGVNDLASGKEVAMEESTMMS